MADIFISYSRRDKAFVQQLFDTMTKAQRDVWVDWEDIPSAADWQKEINEGIEEAHTFIFVISPDSVNSPYCRQEVEYAAARKKRVIPILYREVPDGDDAKMHSAVSSHNWIMMREGQETLDATLPKLLKTIDTDLDYVKMHRRLYVKAQEWDNHQREDSYLLKGAELGEASNWLAVADTKDPDPTPLHSVYVIASRDAQRKQSRQLLMAALAAVVVSLILAVFAINRAVVAENQKAIAVTAQSVAVAEADSRATQESIAVAAQNRAEEQAAIAQTQQAIAETEEARAEREAAVARSQALASGARSVAAQDQFAALALAMQAVSIENPPLAAQRTFAELAYSPGPAYLFTSQDQAVLGIDQTGLVLVQTQAGDLQVWNVLQNQLLQTFSEKHPESSRAVFTADSQMVVTGSPESGVILWDAAAGEVIWKLGNAGKEWQMLAFDQNKTRLLTATVGDEAIIWDIETRSVLRQIPSEAGLRIESAALSPDGRLMAIGTASGQITVLEIDSGELVQTFELPGLVNQLRFTQDGERLVVMQDTNTLNLFDLNSGAVVQTFSQSDNTIITTVTLSPSDTQIAAGTIAGDVMIWDMESGEVVQRFSGQESGIDYVLFSADEQLIISRSFNSNSVVYWDRRHGEVIQQSEPVTASLADIQVNAAGTRVLTADEITAQAAVWNMENGEAIATVSDSEHPLDRASFYDENSIITAGYDGTLTEWIIESGEAARRISIESYIDARFSPNGVLFMTLHNDNRWVVWDTETGEQLWSKPMNFPWFQAVFSKDSQMLFITTLEGSVFLFDAHAGTELWQQSLSTLGGVTFGAFSPDNSQLLVGSATGSIFLMNASDGSLIRTYNGHNNLITAVFFSPDGTQLLTADFNNTAIWWDKTTGEQLYIYSPLPNIPVLFALNPDTHTLFSGLADGSFLWLRADTVDSLKQWAQDNRAVLSMTCEEQRLYDVQVSANCDQTGG